MANELLNTPELAPSEVRAEAPFITRMMGGLGLFLFVVGFSSALAASGAFGYASTDGMGGAKQPYGLLGLGTSYLVTLLALALMFIHAVSDNEMEVRRAYGGFAAVLLLAAVLVSVIPYPFNTFLKFPNLMPWGVLLGLVGLLFSVPFLRNETDEKLQRMASYIMLGFGLTLCLVSLLTGVFNPEFLVGPGLAVGLLGLGFLMVYFNQQDLSDGLPFLVAMGLGIAGAIVLAYAIGRTFAPTVLFEGPTALKLPSQEYDKWKVAGRVLLIIGSFGLSVWAVLGRMAPWLRGVLGVLGLTLTGVFTVGSFTAPITTPPPNFLIPYGLILGFLGVLYLGVSLTSTSDEQFLVLFRRELSAYFYSPIAYLVLFGSGFAASLGYGVFLLSLSLFDNQPRATDEPILQNYMSLNIIGAFITVFLVPVITMRLLSEEQRTGTMEVLLTAPVNEPVIVLSKFFASWLFFMMTWLPAGLFLVGLQAVSDPSTVDLLPLCGLHRSSIYCDWLVLQQSDQQPNRSRGHDLCCDDVLVAQYDLPAGGTIARRPDHRAIPIRLLAALGRGHDGATPRSSDRLPVESGRVLAVPDH
jgi:ABC-2 type transport system permease protein